MGATALIASGTLATAVPTRVFWIAKRSTTRPGGLGVRQRHARATRVESRHVEPRSGSRTLEHRGRGARNRENRGCVSAYCWGEGAFRTLSPAADMPTGTYEGLMDLIPGAVGEALLPTRSAINAMRFADASRSSRYFSAFPRPATLPQAQRRPRCAAGAGSAGPRVTSRSISAICLSAVIVRCPAAGRSFVASCARPTRRLWR